MKTEIKSKKQIFMKIWMRVGFPILIVTIAAFYFVLYLSLISMELLRGSRVERISVELAWKLSNTDLTDEKAVREQLDSLSGFGMVGILFDEDGMEIARSGIESCTDADTDLTVQYHEMEEMILEIHAGNGEDRNQQVYAFAPNYWCEQVQVSVPQGKYLLSCAGVTALWQRHGSKFIAMGLGFLQRCSY